MSPQINQSDVFSMHIGIKTIKKGALFHALVASFMNVEVANLELPYSKGLSAVVDLVILSSSFMVSILHWRGLFAFVEAFRNCLNVCDLFMNDSFQIPVFMKNIYTSLTENNGEEGILKGLVDENEIQDLLANPFNISGNNIKVGRRNK